MANLFVHFEIHATDPQKLIDFYSELLGWSFQQFDEMPLLGDRNWRGCGLTRRCRTGINGGLSQRRGPRPDVGAPVNGCNIVVAVDDVDGTFARGIELGGTEALAPDDMPGVGRLAYLLDLDGNVFGFLSPMLSDGTNAMG